MSESSAVRLFPSISSFAEGSGWRRDPAAGSPADALIAAASRPLRRWQRWTGASLDPASRLTRLLATYRAAVEAEVSGRITRADFFWRGVLDQLPRVIEPEHWRTIARTVCGANIPDDEIAELRIRLVTEVFLDTYTTFYAAYAQSEGRHHRAFAHSAHIGSVLRIEPAAGTHAKQTFAPLLQAEIEKGGQAKDWHGALRAARTAMAYFPGELQYEDSVAYAIHAQAIDRLSDSNGERASRLNAAVLMDAINEIHTITQQLPSNSIAFTVTASLLHMRAVQLANSGALSQALVDVEKASVYNPQEKGIDETRAKLAELMQQRLKDVQDMLDELSRRPNAQLNAQGQAFLADATSGFKPYNQFVESDQRRSIASAAAYARAATLFRRVGLAIPPHEELYAAEEELGSGLVEVLSSPPEVLEGIAGAWSAVVSAQPALHKYPADLIHRYLSRRLFEQEQKNEPPAPEITLQPARSSVEPLGPWLFSRNAPVAKLLTAAAVVAVAWTSITAVATAQRRAARDSAFARVEAAVAAKDDLRTIAAAEEYFKTTPAPEGDATREAHALSHYREALARTFIRKPGAPDPNDLEMLRRYRTATKHLQVAEVRQ